MGVWLFFCCVVAGVEEVEDFVGDVVGGGGEEDVVVEGAGGEDEVVASVGVDGVDDAVDAVAHLYAEVLLLEHEFLCLGLLEVLELLFFAHEAALFVFGAFAGEECLVFEFVLEVDHFVLQAACALVEVEACVFLFFEECFVGCECEVVVVEECVDVDYCYRQCGALFDFEVGAWCVGRGRCGLCFCA